MATDYDLLHLKASLSRKGILLPPKHYLVTDPNNRDWYILRRNGTSVYRFRHIREIKEWLAERKQKLQAKQPKVKKKKPYHRPKIQRDCMICGKTFIPPHGTTKVCSRKCRIARDTQRHREYRRLAREAKKTET